MHDLRTKQTLKWWPSLQDYNEAIQMPMASLQDAELKSGMPYTSALGLPRPISGAFASVYRMHCSKSDYALRLFLRNIEDQSARYARISDFVQHDSLPYTVTFDFLSNGIKTHGDWFPALKMEWVEGVPFEEYIIDNLNDSKKLGEPLKSFVQMMNEMRFAGIAHGDLQHGNIIMCNKELRLVDYDGMFVPAMKNFMATELGHPNFQHPGRAQHHFGPYLDNFSAWIIYASIRALQIDPGLLNQLGGGDDCLLFRQSDFKEPLKSAAFAAFEKHKSEELQMLGRFIRAQLTKDVTQVPYLQLPVPGVSTSKMTKIADDVSTVKSGPRILRSDGSDWLHAENVGALLKPGVSSVNSTYSQPNPNSWVVQPKPPQPSVWVKPTAQKPSIKVTAPPPQPATSSMLPQMSLPAALVGSITPRPVVFDYNASPVKPEVYQLMMIFFPFLWMMVFYFHTAYTTDEDLRVNAKTYDATIKSVVRYDTTSKSTVTHHTDVDSVYVANGHKYVISRDMFGDGGKFKKGDIYEVRALASNPDINEPYGSPAGTRQSQDAGWGWLNFFFVLVVELLIWCKPLWHRHLAKNGIPTIATIEQLIKTPGPKGSVQYNVVVSYNINTQQYRFSTPVGVEMYTNLHQGTKEVIICSPTTPTTFVFYKFCAYKAVLPQPFKPNIGGPFAKTGP